MSDQISFSYLENRWREFWNFENHDRPLLSVTAPAEKPVPFRWGETLSLREQWLSADYAAARGENAIENTCYEGEAFPVFNPNLGPDLLGALCGCELEFAETTSWAKPLVNDWDSFPAPVFDSKNFWMEKIREITRKACEASQGRWLVGITDLHPGVDSLVSLRGPQELCFDLADSPEIFAERERQIFEVYRRVFEDLTDLVSRYQKGSTNWMGIWNPDRPWYVISADFSCMVSEKDYDRYILPSVQWEAELLPDNMYHLDGPGALRHLNTILKQEGVRGVQWVYGAGQPSAAHWIPVLRKIQEAGKLIQVRCLAEDVAPVCAALRPEGVHLICTAPDRESARALIRIAERSTHDCGR